MPRWVRTGTVKLSKPADFARFRGRQTRAEKIGPAPTTISVGPPTLKRGGSTRRSYANGDLSPHVAPYLAALRCVVTGPAGAVGRTDAMATTAAASRMTAAMITLSSIQEVPARIHLLLLGDP